MFSQISFQLSLTKYIPLRKKNGKVNTVFSVPGILPFYFELHFLAMCFKVKIIPAIIQLVTSDIQIHL